METEPALPLTGERHHQALRRACVRLMFVLVVLICIAGVVSIHPGHHVVTQAPLQRATSPPATPHDALRCRTVLRRTADGRWPEVRRTDVRSQLRERDVAGTRSGH
jgi:hypothetical protein